MSVEEISYDESTFLDISEEVIVSLDENNNETSDDNTPPTPLITSTPVAVDKRQYRCIRCPYKSKSRGNLSRHKQAAHLNKRNQCTSCDKTYSSLYDLQTHMKSIHQKDPLMCETCSLRFNSRGSLKRHRTMNHLGHCKFVCDTCGKKYYEKEAYVGHINKHVGSKPYTCNLCQASFGYISCLRRHLTTCPNKTERKEHKGDTCGAVLNSRSVLLDHIQGKHGSKYFSCACGKTFSCRPSFSRHRKNCKLA